MTTTRAVEEAVEVAEHAEEALAEPELQPVSDAAERPKRIVVSARR
jgi:hypothetical protein